MTKRQKSRLSRYGHTVLLLSAISLCACTNSENSSRPPPPDSETELRRAVQQRDFSRAYSLALELEQNSPDNPALPKMFRAIGEYYFARSSPDGTPANKRRALACLKRLPKNGWRLRRGVYLGLCDLDFLDSRAPAKALADANALMDSADAGGDESPDSWAPMRRALRNAGLAGPRLDAPRFDPTFQSADHRYLTRARLFQLLVIQHGEWASAGMDRAAALFHALITSIAVTEDKPGEPATRTPMGVLFSGVATIEELALLYHRILAVGDDVDSTLVVRGKGSTPEKPGRVIGVEVTERRATGTPRRVVFDFGAGAPLCSKSMRAPSTSPREAAEQLRARNSPLAASGVMPYIRAEDLLREQRFIAPDPLSMTTRFRALQRMLEPGERRLFPRWFLDPERVQRGSGASSPRLLLRSYREAPAMPANRAGWAEYENARLGELQGGNAIPAYRAILEKYRGRLDAELETAMRFHVARALFALGRDADAEMAFRNLLDQTGQSRWDNLAWYYRGVLALRHNAKKQADQAFNNVSGPLRYRAMLTRAGRMKDAD